MANTGTRFVVASLSCLCLGSTVHAQLLGVTTNISHVASLVQIDTTTGAATEIFSFTMPTPAGDDLHGLARDPGTGHLFSLLPDSHLVAEIDPILHAVTYHSFSGPDVRESIEYSDLLGSLLVGHQNGSTATHTLSKMNPDGTFGATVDLGNVLEDMDMLGLDPRDGSLLAYDVSNPINGYILNRINDPFGSPSLTGIYNGPGDPLNDYDLAAHQGTLYLSNLFTLYKFSGDLQSRNAIGAFGLSDGRGVAALASVRSRSRWPGSGPV